MGGCRCSFRNCNVSTNSQPGISFFHYPHPVKRKEKFEKWIKYSNRPEIRLLQVPQIINRVVCANHFRDESFMNYMRNKLTQSAVPTLDLLENGMVLDYETGDNPKPTKLSPTPYEHLRPPAEKTLPGDEDFISMDPDGSIFLLNIAPVNETPNDLNNSSYNIYSENDSYEAITLSSDSLQTTEPKTKKLKLFEDVKELRPDIKLHKQKTKNIQKNKTIKIHNAISKLTYSTNNSSELNLNENKDETEFENIQNIEIIDDSLIALPNNNLFSSHDDLITEIDCIEKTTTFTENELNQILQLKQTEFDAELKEFKETSKSEMKELLNMSVDELNKKKDELKQQSLEYDKLKQELESLKKEHACKINEHKNEIIQLKKENTKTNSALAVKNPSARAGVVTKPQLFNGVKKYLSPSMSALVRMEMFGAPERPWKSDEKQCSVELMKLGKNVYDYFRDEWRCRLPSNKDVEKWINEASYSEEEEIL